MKVRGRAYTGLITTGIRRLQFSHIARKNLTDTENESLECY